MKKTALISAFAAALLCLIIFSACNGSVNLSDTLWVPDSANNASGDEVISEEALAQMDVTVDVMRMMTDFRRDWNFYCPEEL